MASNQADARLTQQQRTRSPSPGPRRSGSPEQGVSPVRNLSQVINLGEIKSPHSAIPPQRDSRELR